jgi:hypothetical protein
MGPPTHGRRLVSEANFIRATRDAGYKTLSTAIAELVDNALQAGATTIHIFVLEARDDNGARQISIAVLDDGHGMARSTLQGALQFGGTERFDDRSGFGRFGMGLPNSSVSQAPRVEVYSWLKQGRVFRVYLDIDEFVNRQRRSIPGPVEASLPRWALRVAGPTGTLVLWTRCDRLKERKASTIGKRLRGALARLYRHVLWRGVHIVVNGEELQPIDPLLRTSDKINGGSVPFGDPLILEVRSPLSEAASTIEVRFTELPVELWHDLATETKRAIGLTGGAGVSVVRYDREIDHGWYFMGEKRKENYDDWWRCEIRFAPELDELFGVTNNKQGINPTPDLRAILEPSLEPIARLLNRRVRQAFERVKESRPSPAAVAASHRDRVLPNIGPDCRRGPGGVAGYQYAIEIHALETPEFFQVRTNGDRIIVVLNEYHPFYHRVYARACNTADQEERFRLESLLLASARAALAARSPAEREWEERHRGLWSDALSAFLSY